MDIYQKSLQEFGFDISQIRHLKGRNAPLAPFRSARCHGKRKVDGQNRPKIHQTPAEWNALPPPPTVVKTEFGVKPESTWAPIAKPGLCQPFQAIQQVELASGVMWGATLRVPDTKNDCHLGFFQTEMAALQCHHRAQKAVSEGALEEFLEFLRKQRKMGVEVSEIGPPRKKRRYRRRVESKHEKWKKERLEGNRRLADKIRAKRLEVLKSKRKHTSTLQSPTSVALKTENTDPAAILKDLSGTGTLFASTVKVEPRGSHCWFPEPQPDFPANSTALPQLERSPEQVLKQIDHVSALLNQARNMGKNVSLYESSSDNTELSKSGL